MVGKLVIFIVPWASILIIQFQMAYNGGYVDKGPQHANTK
jgi:hypothetical protein